MGTMVQSIGLTPAQKLARRSGIGASEVGAVLGLDRYKSPLDVWLEKTGRVELDWSPTSQAAKMGHLLEPVVAALAEEWYTDLFAPLPVMLQTSDTLVGREPWQRATPDRIVSIGNNRRLLECKTKSWHTFKDFGEPGTDQVPDGILLQALWQMDVTQIRGCDVAVLVDGREIHFYPVTYDPGLALDVFERVRDWWQAHVVQDIEPPVARSSDVKYLKQKFSRVREELAPPTEALTEAVARLAQAKAEAKAAEEAEELAKARVMELLGEAKGVHTPAGKVSWALQKGAARTDWKKIADIMGTPPELIVEHTTIPEPSRVFRFTPSKES